MLHTGERWKKNKKKHSHSEYLNVYYHSVYVCVCIGYTYVCMCVCTCYVCICMCVHIFMRIYVYVCVCMYVHIYVCIYESMYQAMEDTTTVQQQQNYVESCLLIL